MKISVIYDETTDFVSINKAKYIGDYAIRIEFNDNKEKLVDFKPFLSNSGHPAIQKYLDEQLFENFQIKNGNLNWNDFDLIFPIEELYNNSIQF